MVFRSNLENWPLGGSWLAMGWSWSSWELFGWPRAALGALRGSIISTKPPINRTAAVMLGDDESSWGVGRIRRAFFSGGLGVLKKMNESPSKAYKTHKNPRKTCEKAIIS